MPYKPKHPCNRPGCPELTNGRYCEAHSDTERVKYDRYRRDPDTAKRYGTQWRHVRAAYIARHPLCEQCQQAGRLTPAQEVHHRYPLADGGTHEASNLQALCKRCHSAITIREARNAGG